MNILQAILLGIIQGLTEFLPISSSAHLVLAPYLLGWSIPKEQVFVFDTLVQLGTLFAVIVYYWNDLFAILRAVIAGLVKRQPFADPYARLGWLLVLATIPAGLAALLIKDTVEAAFNSPAATGAFLMVTAAILLAAEHFGRKQRDMESLDWKDALWIGLGQALALFPGVSRSGATISAGMACGFKRPAAARFSFLMSVPVMLAMGVSSSLDLLDVPNLTSFLPVVLVGMVTAGVVGYFSIHWLISFLGKHSLRAFSIYCACLSILTLAVYFFQ